MYPPRNTSRQVFISERPPILTAHQSSPFVPDPRGTHRTADSLSASLWESVRSGTPFFSDFGDRTEVHDTSNGQITQNGKPKHTQSHVHSRSRATNGVGSGDWGKMYPESMRMCIRPISRVFFPCITFFVDRPIIACALFVIRR